MKEFNFAPELAPIICDIYNQSLRKEYISSLLRYFIVTLFPKVCPPGAIEKDIRPISLTCTVSKIMEGFTTAPDFYPSWKTRLILGSMLARGIGH